MKKSAPWRPTHGAVQDHRSATRRVHLTFSLPGFSSIKGEGIDLAAGFTATVNAEMRVGGVEETITAAGQSPTIDVTTVRRQTVLSNDTLSSLPSQRSPQSFVPYLPGVVGGLGDIGRDTALLSIHGGRAGEANVAIDGANDHTFEASGGGAGFTYYINQGSVQEVTVTTGAESAEQALSGITTNLIPKEGGNTFSSNLVVAYTDENLQASNLTQKLIGQGLTATNRLKKSGTSIRRGADAWCATNCGSITPSVTGAPTRTLPGSTGTPRRSLIRIRQI